MSEKLTRIRVPGIIGGDYGYQDYGEHTRAEMVKKIRARANYLRDVVARIDATRDEDFEVDIIRGPYAQHHIRKVD